MFFKVLFAELKFTAYFSYFICKYAQKLINNIEFISRILSFCFNSNFFWQSKVPCIFAFVFSLIARFTSTKHAKYFS